MILYSSLYLLTCEVSTCPVDHCLKDYSVFRVVNLCVLKKNQPDAKGEGGRICLNVSIRRQLILHEIYVP